jgi:DNA-directed RNA polymerase specialized sigma24 family protein
MYGKLQPLEVLAIIAFRQWLWDRSAIRNGRTTSYKRTGYRERRQRDADATIVRAMDFERALGMLPPDQQAALLLTYHTGATRPDIARALSCSDRTAHTLLDTARAKLAQVLERLDLI